MKTILIIGASSDLGVALIREIYDDYDVIYAHCNSNTKALEAEGDKVRILRANLGSESETARFFEELQGIEPPDDMVHLAARPIRYEKLPKLGWAEFQAEADVSLRSAYLAMAAFLPAMQKRGGGHAVFAASSVTEHPVKYLAAYAAAKSALVGLVRAAAAEYPSVRICAVSPGMFESKFLANLPRLAVEQAAKSSLRGSLLSVADVVPTLMSLLSDGESGQNILVE